jgi:5-methyltetrahydrofolate--homocysteine methyltransferase
MTRQGLDVLVMLGGAALTANMSSRTASRLTAPAGSPMRAFDGLHLMDRIVTGGFDGYLAERQAQARARRRKNRARLPLNGEAAAL